VVLARGLEGRTAQSSRVLLNTPMFQTFSVFSKLIQKISGFVFKLWGAGAIA